MSGDEQAIRETVQKWMDATLRGDIPSVLELMAEDVVFIGPARQPMRGRDAFAAASRAMESKFRVEGKADIQEVVASGDWAYSWVDITVTITPIAGGPAAHRSGPAMSIWRKQPDGRWVIYRDANMVTTDQR
jgi:uncharacterized protein (TIGR02246 family)